MNAELRFFSMGALLLLHGSTIAAGAPSDTIFEFSTQKYSITMRVSFPASYEGTRLAVYRNTGPAGETCLFVQAATSGCIENFVGAVAVIGFAVKRLDGRRPAAASIREAVTVLDQSPGLPARAPFAMSIKLIDGMGSDLQAFGYDESSLPPAQRAAEREAAKAVWRNYRQELFMDKDQKPFVVIEWSHTTTRIRILQVRTPHSPAAE